MEIAGFRRVASAPDPDMQLQRDALFTIGRLAREGQLELYTYFELMVEQWRHKKGREQVGSAFRGCAWQKCKAALERTSYFQGIGMDALMAKGGKEDRKHGKTENNLSQITFFKFLLDLSPESAERYIAFGQPIVRTDFDKASLRDLDWFKRASRVAPSDENLPDFFHLWTARRNGMDVFLTLEKKLPKWADSLAQNELLGQLSILRPTDLAQKLGVDELDPVPFEMDTFYSFWELIGNDFKGWNSE